MRALWIDRHGGPDQIKKIERPAPKPGKGEVLVRVVAAGVSRVDAQQRAGEQLERWPFPLPAVPGNEVAGVVESFGPGAEKYRGGDKIWGLLRVDVRRSGGYAEAVPLPVDAVAPMPKKLLFEEAAALPLSGLAAFQALSRVSGLGSAHTVAVLGAAGGVGHIALQLLRNRGVRAIAIARGAGVDAVRDWGAVASVDCSSESIEEGLLRCAPSKVDLLLDLVGGDAARQAIPAIKQGGGLLSFVEKPDPQLLESAGIRGARLEVKPSGDDLAMLSELADLNRLRPQLAGIGSLDDAVAFHERLDEGGVHGKLVLNL